MDVLISWSKKQSREMASAFYGWLPKVVPGFRPWMSSKDIDKGKQWFGELQDFLGEATSCIICVTAENVRSPWIYYETGAIAAKKQDVLVCPYLVGIGVGMIADGPLAQYQCTEATKDDTFALIRSLNKALATPHDEGLLTGNFETRWPEFEAELKRILGMDVAAPADFVETEADVLAGYKLSAEARFLLVVAAQAEGWITQEAIRGDSCQFVVGGKHLPSDSRSEVFFLDALKRLRERGLVKLRQNIQFRRAWQLTAKGYDVADLLRKQHDDK